MFTIWVTESQSSVIARCKGRQTSKSELGTVTTPVTQKNKIVAYREAVTSEKLRRWENCPYHRSGGSAKILQGNFNLSFPITFLSKPQYLCSEFLLTRTSGLRSDVIKYFPFCKSQHLMLVTTPHVSHNP